MKYQDKEILEMTDAELLAASQTITLMQNNNDLAKSSEQYKEKMKNRPLPETNPVFLELKEALFNEIDKRKI